MAEGSRIELLSGAIDLSKNRLISVIDDDPSIVEAIAGFVRSLGYQASGHLSAEAFLSSGEVQSANCVITDIQMPGLSGIALKHHLNAIRVDTPVIMITARTDATLLADARSSGAICVFGKPFDATDLIACIERALAG